MKKISNDVARLIEDFVAESETNLAGYAIEKDIHVLDAIKLIASMPQNEFFSLVFCGGTCLSKAYGILERMSEDVDFKIIPTAAGMALGNSALRTRLSEFVKTVIDLLGQNGFDGEGSIVRRSRDGNKYSSLDIAYSSAFQKPASLRPHLQIELNFTQLNRQTNQMPVGLLLDKMIHGKYMLPISVDCISLEEALSEKLISFPRRLASQLSRFPESPLSKENGWDEALVRHLYDTQQITKHMDGFSGSAEMAKLVSRVIDKDASDFFNQHSAFAVDPVKEILCAMAWAAESRPLEQQYTRFVNDMVYSTERDTPSFAEAITHFTATLSGALNQISYEELPFVSKTRVAAIDKLSPYK